MNKKKQRNLVYNNLHSGNDLVQGLKEIIRESVYPENPEYFSGSGLAIATRTFQTYKKTTDDAYGLLDLMLFFVECGSQFTLDYGDIDEDFYVALEESFGDALELMKTLGNSIPDQFQERVYFIEKETSDIGWGYGDQINDLIEMHFPDFQDTYANK